MVFDNALQVRIPAGGSRGLTYYSFSPGIRWSGRSFAIAVAARLGVGSWVELGEQYGVGVEISFRP